MIQTNLAALLGVCLVVGYVANRLFRRTRVPDVIVLIAIGILLGPLLRIVKAEGYRDEIALFGTLALIMVLFEGGLRINLAESTKVLGGAALFGLLNFAITAIGITLLFHYWLGIPNVPATMAGAALGCNSSAIVVPLLQQLELKEQVRTTVVVESLLGNLLAVLMVAILIGGGDLGSSILDDLAIGFLFKTSISIIVAVNCGIATCTLLPSITEHRYWHVVTLGIVLLLYSFSRVIGGSGLLAVFIFAVTLANRPPFRTQDATTMSFFENERHLEALGFHSELGFLLRSIFFVMLGVVSEFSTQVGWATIALIVGLMFVSRGIAIQGSRWLWRDLDSSDRIALLWFLPRGLVTAVLSIQIIDAVGPSVAFLFPVSFAVILLSNLGMLLGTARINATGTK